LWTWTCSPGAIARPAKPVLGNGVAFLDGRDSELVSHLDGRRQLDGAAIQLHFRAGGDGPPRHGNVVVRAQVNGVIGKRRRHRHGIKTWNVKLGT
jgi:hypothetical protein